MTNIRAFAIIHYNEQKRVTINISLNSLAVKNLNIVTYWQILNKYSQIQVPRKYFQSRGHLKVQLCHVSEFFVFSFFSLHSPPATSLLLSDLHSLFLSFAKLCRCSLQNLIVSGRILTRTTLWTYARPCLPNNIGTAMLLCFFFFFFAVSSNEYIYRIATLDSLEIKKHHAAANKKSYLWQRHVHTDYRVALYGKLYLRKRALARRTREPYRFHD